MGSTCLTYSVGAPGDSLNFASLVPGAGWGGPAPLRSVQLASVFGTNLVREGLDWGSLLPNCVPSNMTAATCGPAALNFSAYDPVTEQAASDAKALGVNFEVIFGTGGAIDGGLVVNNGGTLWSQDVQAIATHFATSAPDLTALEAWNEPNSTFGAASQYVTRVLAPFRGAVTAVNAATGHTDRVVGGTVVGMDMSYWQQFASAGGFSDLDIVATHPYTGYDDSYEEDDIPDQLQNLENLMAQNGAAGKPVWITEQGWWSNTSGTFYPAGNWVARAWMWNKSLGINSWNYYITEGGFQGGGMSWSLIQAGSEDDYVKPDGIALMTVSRLLGARPYLGFVPTGIPHAYAMLFGPPPGSSTDVLAAWTDDVWVGAAATLAAGTAPVTIPTTGVLGQTGSISVAPGAQTPITLSGAPTYFTVPAGDTLALSAAQGFGPDLALQHGATVSASSGSAVAAVRSVAAAAGTPDATSDNGAVFGGWQAAATDTSPSLTVVLASPQAIDRVLVATSTLGSVMPGLQNYVVQADVQGVWTTVAGETDQYFDRSMVLTFPAVTATAVRLLPQSENFGGDAGGLMPWYWVPGSTGAGAVYSLEIYGPGAAPPGATLPIVGGVSPGGGAASGGTTVTVTGSNLFGATGVSFGGTPATSVVVNSASSVSATAPAGSGTVDVTVTTPFGTSAPGAAGRFSYAAPPVVGSVSPGSGLAGGGTLVTISGSNFAGATGVSFGGVPATGVVVNSASAVSATAPAGSGTVDVTVTTPFGTSATGSADRFSYTPPPTVAGVSPGSGVAAGGTVVTLSGANFTGATGVSFGGVPATGVVISSASSVSATAPAGSGTVDVTVTTPFGTSATGSPDRFSYAAPPVVGSVSPGSGLAAGGTLVTISGSSFTGATGVSFGGVAATGVIVNSASSVSAIAPAGSGTVDVRVTTPFGTSATGSADQFAYVAPPVVSGLPQVALGPATREAAVWYDPHELQLQLTFAKAFSGNLELYAVDWDHAARRETITVGGQTVNLSSDFSQGVWIVFPITVAAGGTVPINVVNMAGNTANAVLSGVFLDPGTGLSQPQQSTAPQGNWVGDYGTGGYALAAWSGSGDLTALPSATLSLIAGQRFAWNTATTDVRALQAPVQSVTNPIELAREAATWYDPHEVQLQLSFTKAFSGNLELYALDWDNAERRETITVGGQSVTLSSNFSAGRWVVFPVTVAAGSTVAINVVNNAVQRLGNAVLSGVFLDPGTGVSQPQQFTAPQGNWVGAYGTGGYALAAWSGSGDLTALPGATLSLIAGERFVWTAATTDVRGLESPM